MSHIAQVQIEITNLDDLDQACRRIGLEFVRGQTEFRYYAGQLSPCEHAIRVPPASVAEGRQPPYEMGVRRREDGKPGWMLEWDPFAGGMRLTDIVGRDCGRLKQAYGLCAARRVAQAQGFRSVGEPQLLPNGSIRLTLEK